MYTVLVHLIFHQNTHQCADLHTSVVTLYTITSLLILHAMLILHVNFILCYFILFYVMLILC